MLTQRTHGPGAATVRNHHGATSALALPVGVADSIPIGLAAAGAVTIRDQVVTGAAGAGRGRAGV